MNTVEIKNFDHQGRGIGKLDNKTVFINNALPNEVVNFSITKEKKNFAEGKVNSYVTTSPDRIESICPHFDNCGGCDIMHISYEKQLDFKQNKIKNIMDRFCDVKFPIRNIIGSNNLYYRNKVTLHAKDKRLGYFKEKSNCLVPIDKCYLLDGKINEIYEVIKSKSNLNNIDTIVIRKSIKCDESMVTLYTNGNINEQEWINLLSNLVDNIIVYNKDKFKTILGNDYIIEQLFDKKFVIKTDSFFQVNTLQTEKLYSKALEYADIKDDETVIDLYCGTGTIGILASKYAKEVIGIELNSAAVKSANKNKEINNIDNINFFVGDVGTVLKQNNYYNKKIDTVIVDPPRAGLDELAINEIFKIGSKKLVYVSCDPMTLARDLNKLSEKYEVKELTPVDMFPSTAHVECVSVLSRKSPENKGL